MNLTPVLTLKGMLDTYRNAAGGLNTLTVILLKSDLAPDPDILPGLQ